VNLVRLKLACLSVGSEALLCFHPSNGLGQQRYIFGLLICLCVRSCIFTCLLARAKAFSNRQAIDFFCEMCSQSTYF